MSILSFITDIFKPASEIIDELHVSEEERGKLRNELAKTQAKAQQELLKFESKVLETKAQISIAESSSKHWITATWRPLCSILLVGIIVLAAFDLAHPKPELYELAKIFLGTYAGGRSFEKMLNVSKLGK